MTERISEAIQDYVDLHWGDDPEEVLEIDDTRYDGEILVALGELAELTYLTQKGGELAEYVHEFEDDRPLLCIDRCGNLHIVGGTYTVDPRGIVG